MGNNTSLYSFTSHTFTNAGATGPKGPTLAQVRSAYSGVSWASTYVNMTNDNGIQLWTVPTTGNYKIQAVGAGVPYDSNRVTNGQNQYQKGIDISITIKLIQGEIIKILVGQSPIQRSPTYGSAGAGGTFVCYKEKDIPIIIAGGGGGKGSQKAGVLSNATEKISGQVGDGINPFGYTQAFGWDRRYGYGYGGTNGKGGGSSLSASGGGGYLTDGEKDFFSYSGGGVSFKNGSYGGMQLTNYFNPEEGGFGGGGASGGSGGGGGGGYSGGGAGSNEYAGGRGAYTDDGPKPSSSGGGGGSYSITEKFDSISVNNNSNGFVVITLQPPTPLPYSSNYLNLVGDLKFKGNSFIDNNLQINNNGNQVAGISNNGDLMLKGNIVFGDNINNAWKISADENNFHIQRSGEQGISITSKGVVTPAPVLNINSWTFPKF